MMDKLFGLPSHPLFVHLPVVCTPLAALGVVAIVLSKRARSRYAWLVVVLAVAAAVGTQLAYSSGQKLLRRVDRTPAISHHADLARTDRPFVFVFALAVVAYAGAPVLVQAIRRGRRIGPDETPAATARWVLVGLGVLTLGAGVAATTATVVTSHQGAKATWSGIGEQRPSR